MKKANLKELEIEVSYQDTDTAGVVYFGNYFNYAEKARYKIIKGLFSDIKEHWAVKNTTANYLKPVKLGDTILVKTDISLRLASINFQHNFYVKEDLVCSMNAMLFSIDDNLKPTRIKQKFLEILQTIFPKGE